MTDKRTIWSDFIILYLKSRKPIRSIQIINRRGRGNKMVDIDLETVINFCDKFEKEYLEILHQNAQRLKVAASSVTETLKGTEMATKSSVKLEMIADALYKATQTGEERILELKKRAQRELDEKERIEGRIR